MLTLDEVMDAVRGEIAYQDEKWGRDKQQSLPGYILVMQKELDKARDGWCTDTTGRGSALSEILQVVTVGMRCLQQYGVTGWAEATNDIAIAQQRESRYRDATIILTLASGPTIVVGKNHFVQVTRGPLGNSIVETRTGKHEVLESIKTIQAMLQD